MGSTSGCAVCRTCLTLPAQSDSLLVAASAAPAACPGGACWNRFFAILLSRLINVLLLHWNTYESTWLQEVASVVRVSRAMFWTLQRLKAQQHHSRFFLHFYGFRLRITRQILRYCLLLLLTLSWQSLTTTNRRNQLHGQFQLMDWTRTHLVEHCQLLNSTRNNLAGQFQSIDLTRNHSAG